MFDAVRVRLGLIRRLSQALSICSELGGVVLDTLTALVNRAHYPTHRLIHEADPPPK
jgi:hypothetical protein